MHDSPDPDKRKIGKKGCLFGCLGIALLLVGLPLLVLLTWSATAARSAQDRLARLQGLGYPVAAEELGKFYKLPDGAVDRTNEWIDAIDTFQGDEYGLDTRSLPIVGAEGPASIPSANAEWEQLEEVATLLNKYDLGMALMHEAARQGGKIRFDRKYSDGLQMLLPNITQLRSGARMLQLEAHVQAHHGDPEGIVKSFRTLLALSHANDADPVIVSQLVNTSIRGQAFTTLQAILPFIDFSDAQLNELQDLFASSSNSVGFKAALVGERAFAISAFSNPRAALQTQGPNISLGSRNEDLCFYLDLLEPVIESVSAKSWIPTMDAAQKMDASLKQMSTSQINKLRYQMTSMLLPAVEGIMSAGAGDDAKCRIAELACALQRYRKASGEYPQTLDALAPQYIAKVPLDPFDDLPLRYEVRSGTPVIWSIGRDRLDNGGLKDNSELDICFELPLVN